MLTLTVTKLPRFLAAEEIGYIRHHPPVEEKVVGEKLAKHFRQLIDVMHIRVSFMSYFIKRG